MIRTEFSRRRITNTALLAIFAALMLFASEVWRTALLDQSEWTGWLLFSLIAFLFLFLARKRLSMFPIGRMAHWLQAHLYVGLFTVLLFCIHSQWRFPAGVIGWSLAITFYGTILTGVLGIFLSRTLPRRITALGDEVLYDRIRSFTSSLRTRSEQIAIDAASETGSVALANFYQYSAQHLFAKPFFQWRRLVSHQSSSKKVEHELIVLNQNCNKTESEFVMKMIELVRQKEILDAHWTYQGALRAWLLVHLFFCFALIPVIFLHIIFVYGFTSL